MPPTDIAALPSSASPSSPQPVSTQPVSTQPGALDAALLESRERWRAFGAIAVDFAWETDTLGRFTFVWPDRLLGWAASDMLGQPGARLLMQAAEGAPPPTDPFTATVPVRRRRAWLSGAQGRATCFALSSDPLHDASGAVIGTRGVGLDVTGREQADLQIAAALRRGEMLELLTTQLRHEMQAPRMMEAILSTVKQGLGALGTAIISVPQNLAAEVLHTIGAPPGPILAVADRLLRAAGSEAQMVAAAAEPQMAQADSGMLVLACPVTTRFGGVRGLVAWRAAHARAWDADDHLLAAAGTGLVRIVLEHEAIQRQLATQARTDPLTRLLNRRAFLEEATRRIDRLDREELPGTLMLLDIDGFTALNNERGQEAGDSVLICAAELLQRTFRPSDILGRVGADEFAVWLDGSDEMTAAERAEALRVQFPLNLAHLPSLTGPGAEPPADAVATVTIGIACRQPGTYEDLDSILSRTTQVLRETRRTGRGQWRVSHTRPSL